VTAGLVRPHWRLLKHHLDGADFKLDVISITGNRGDDTTAQFKFGNNAECLRTKAKDTEYNNLPARNFMDLRMEQNEMFADVQQFHCDAILSKMMSSTHNEYTKQWKKEAAQIQSFLNIGLAACPNHVGLSHAEGEYKRIQRRIQGTPQVNSAAAVPSERIVPNFLRNPTKMAMEKKKGSRAQTAMQDVLLERSFLIDETTDMGGDTKIQPTKPSTMENECAPFSSQCSGSQHKKRHKRNREKRGKKERKKRKQDTKKRKQDTPRSRSKSRSRSPSGSSSSLYRRRNRHKKKRKKEEYYEKKNHHRH